MLLQLAEAVFVIAPVRAGVLDDAVEPRNDLRFNTLGERFIATHEELRGLLLRRDALAKQSLDLFDVVLDVVDVHERSIAPLVFVVKDITAAKSLFLVELLCYIQGMPRRVKPGPGRPRKPDAEKVATYTLSVPVPVIEALRADPERRVMANAAAVRALVRGAARKETRRG